MKLLRTGKPEQAILSLTIDHNLQVAEEFRRVLNLINDEGRPEGLNKKSRVVAGQATCRYIIKRDVIPVGPGTHFQQRRFTYLARSGQQQNGKTVAYGFNCTSQSTLIDNRHGFFVYFGVLIQYKRKKEKIKL